ncbi:hypothetical protein [Paenibacillus donghaensis]|uniref:hypothetical protein n=1 Tax=Paenibacillus donghaensis TaxID=414771 RepID=UPI0012FE2649|nr:hypothetical protein [Paenibacillus donghaensis]
MEDAKTKLSQAGFEEHTVSVFEGGADATMTVHGGKYGAGGIVYETVTSIWNSD